MKIIKRLVDLMDEEIQGAQTYAEKYIEYKAKNDSEWSQKFKEMTNDELKHAMIIHDLAVKEIDSIKKVYTAPVEMQDRWDKSHKEYVEKMARIKQILTM